MLLPNYSNPKKSLYYIGALILEEFKYQDTYDFLELYSIIKQKNPISIQIYILALDWLFLISAVDMDRQRRLQRCI